MLSLKGLDVGVRWWGNSYPIDATGWDVPFHRFDDYFPEGALASVEVSREVRRV